MRGRDLLRWRATGGYEETSRCAEATFYRDGETPEVVQACGTGAMQAEIGPMELASRPARLCVAWSDLEGRPCLMIRQ